MAARAVLQNEVQEMLRRHFCGIGLGDARALAKQAAAVYGRSRHSHVGSNLGGRVPGLGGERIGKPADMAGERLELRPGLVDLPFGGRRRANCAPREFCNQSTAGAGAECARRCLEGRRS